jgi:major membrane immunogen (membrane-anchored lipoprotein)
MLKTIILASCIALLFSACVKEVKPWQKATHAKETMKDGGINALEKKFEEHTYYSKEATKVGNGVAGGGCGCN